MGIAVCPYPGKCVYDDYRRCGVHFCTLPACRHPEACLELLNAEILRVLYDQKPGWKKRWAQLEEEKEKLKGRIAL